MMSGLQIRDDTEILFSFELLVENIQIYKAGKVSKELAVGVRLLDFPTLLIYGPEGRRGGGEEDGEKEEEREEEREEHVFRRGKCCFFKMNLNSLHTHLSNTPVYTMLLDVREELPRLIGTSLISVSAAMTRIKQEVTQHGVSSSSSHGERGIVGICSLSGEQIGEMCVSYKLRSLGGNELQRVTERRRDACINVQEDKTINQRESSETHDESESGRKTSQEEEVLKEREENTTKQSLEDESEDDFTTFCPPRLFFCNSAEERSRNERSQTLSAAGFHEEEEEEERREEVSPVSAQRGKSEVKMPENKKTNPVTLDVLGEAVQQLPLLNALLVELSQLSGQTSQQSPSVHPHLAWIYRAASAEPPQKPRTDLKSLKSPKKFSTPLFKHEEKPEERRSCRTARKKLVFGTTRTFNLRMKRVSPVRRRECVEVRQEEERLMKKGRRRKEASSLNEEVNEDSQKEERLKLSPRDEEEEFVRGDISVREESERQRESESERDRSSRSSDRGGHQEEEEEEEEKEEKEEEDYVDDFHSLEPSDTYSPDLMSSPESSRVKTPRPPARLRSDSSSESLHRRVPVPVPIQAPSSPPQRALRGTHIIRPRTHASALSVSSDDADRDTSASVQTVLSRKQTARGADSPRSSGGQRSEASSRDAPGRSAGSGSSLELHEEDLHQEDLHEEDLHQEDQHQEDLHEEDLHEEDLHEEDQLGSLDFRKQYKHISELVANKLPGYTM